MDFSREVLGVTRAFLQHCLELGIEIIDFFLVFFIQGASFLFFEVLLELASLHELLFAFSIDNTSFSIILHCPLRCLPPTNNIDIILVSLTSNNLLVITVHHHRSDFISDYCFISKHFVNFSLLSVFFLSYRTWISSSILVVALCILAAAARVFLLLLARLVVLSYLCI